MKVYTLLLLFLVSAFMSSAQESNEDLLLFNYGNALYKLVYEDLGIDWELERLDTTDMENRIKFEILTEQKEDILEVSLEYFEQLINEFPESNLIFRAMNNAALISAQLDYKDEAITYYKTIIDSKANDGENGGIGEGLMSEPYALYKNRACKNLAVIYMERKEYKSALKYVDLTQKYPYRHFCGNEYAANDLYVALLYTRCYYGLGEIDKALSFALPHIFNDALANNSRIVELTVQILKENYSQEELISEFEESVKNFYTKKAQRRSDNWEYYFIDFKGVKIELKFFSLEYSDDTEVTLERDIKRSSFYKLLRE